MRRYYIVSGVLLIFLIIDIAVAAPVLVQEKRQEGVDVVHIPEDAITMLGKRGGELNELWLKLFGHPEDHFFPKLEELSAARPSSRSPLSGPAGGSTDIERPLPPILQDPLPVSSPDRAPAPPNLGDGSDNMWLKLFGHPESHFFPTLEESSAARPSSSSPLSGSADGSTDIEQPLSSIPQEPLPVSSPDHAPAPPNSGDGSDNLWLKLFGHPENHFFPKPEELPAAHSPSSSPLSGPADGSTDIKQPPPSIQQELLPVSSPDHTPPPPNPGDGSDNMWLKLFGHPKSHFFPKPEEFSAARPSSSSPLSGPAESTDIERPLPPILQDPLPVSSPDHEQALPNPGVGSDNLWLKLFDHPETHFSPKPEEFSAAHLSSSSPLSGPAESTDIERPLPPILQDPLPVSSPDHEQALPNPGEWSDNWWLKLFDHPENHFPPKPEEPSAARPSSSSLLSRPADGSTDIEQPFPSIHKEPSRLSSPDHAMPRPGSLTESGYELMKGDAPPGSSSPVPSTMLSADHELMAAHVPPNPEPSTESGHEMMDVLPSSPVLSTVPDRQSMGVDSSSGKRKRPD